MFIVECANFEKDNNTISQSWEIVKCETIEEAMVEHEMLVISMLPQHDAIITFTFDENGNYEHIKETKSKRVLDILEANERKRKAAQKRMEW